MIMKLIRGGGIKPGFVMTKYMNAPKLTILILMQSNTANHFPHTTMQRSYD